MANVFQDVPLKKPKRNTFDLSHDVKFSSNMGVLTPILCCEVLPGDTWHLSNSSMLRFAPLVSPVMHRVNVFTHFYFVPTRILWDGFEEFMRSVNGANSVPPPAYPHFINMPVNTSSLADYLGVCTDSDFVNVIDKCSAVPFAAYQCVYNEYYRAQALQEPINYKLTDGSQLGPDATELLKLRRRGWMHDYFTSALPYAQKGDAVNIPLFDMDDVPVKRSYSSQSSVPAIWQAQYQGSPNNLNVLSDVTDASPQGYLFAQTSALDAAGATINDLRTAIRLQEWCEIQARSGDRYIEMIQAHFGVRSSDARLQRPEYIGGTMQPVVISEVLQAAPATSETQTPQGNMAGHGISVGHGKVGSKFCEEHGYIIGIQSVMPLTAYQQGLPKHFSKFDPLDFAYPKFAHLGEQPILNREIFYEEGSASNDEVFGYTPRYAEYKYHDSRVAGKFQTTLNHWHIGRIFENRPSLNAEFIECNPRKDIFAVTSEDSEDLYVQVLHNIKVSRKLPVFGVPTI